MLTALGQGLHDFDSICCEGDYVIKLTFKKNFKNFKRSRERCCSFGGKISVPSSEGYLNKTINLPEYDCPFKCVFINKCPCSNKHPQYYKHPLF